MRNLLLASAAALALSASAAHATLMISVSDGTTTVTCSDGQACDQDGSSSALLKIATQVGGKSVEVTLAQSAFGKTNTLQLSTGGMTALTAGTLTILASDTGFAVPVHSISESASLTFLNNVGAGASSLKFWADPNDVQGANPNNTPGTLLDTVTGTPLTNPDSFSGSHTSLFSSLSPFSMTEGASLNFIAGGSVTGFNESMVTTSVPEPSTWALFIAGFGLMGAFGYRRQLRSRLSAVA